MKRQIININKDWKFIKEDVGPEKAISAEGIGVDLPYTWNGTDGQDGNEDYYRGKCWFVKQLDISNPEKDRQVYLEFKGVNSSAFVYFNGEKAAEHHGGYSTFRVNITEFINKVNTLVVCADNSKNETVYPQTADFTFYGGIYRDVNLIYVNSNHFNLDNYGSCGVKVTPSVKEKCTVKVDADITGSGDVNVKVIDAFGKTVASGVGGENIEVQNATLWDGLKDPYLYTARVSLSSGNEILDELDIRFGFRSFKVDPKEGFFLNGKSYPLRGVCRHQDRPVMGNAISKAEHKEDMEIIKEIGATTIRLAHYQHDDYFYDLCDEYGLIVWAEIPYISRHMPEANANTVSQMTELVLQQYNHPSIVCWGVSNEITMFKQGKEDRYNQHIILNDLCHKLDPTRFTVIANFSMCANGNPIGHITDAASLNLYYGWYFPFPFITGVVLDDFHRRYPDQPVGLSEYGAEAMTNLHSEHPRMGDNSEEYQLIYHEKTLNVINKRKYLWATHVWNMFDFASDSRNQGGEPGMNHKGLVTFDRKNKKDAFYLYKAFWSNVPFVHICGKRFVNRCGNSTKVKVYSNQPEVTLYVNGKPFDTKKSEKVFNFVVPLVSDVKLEAKCNGVSDKSFIKKVTSRDENYRLHIKSNNHSWEK